MNTMVMSDFRPEIWPLHTHAVKNTQCNPYLWPNHRNFHVLRDIGVEEHGGDASHFRLEVWPFRTCAVTCGIKLLWVTSLNCRNEECRHTSWHFQTKRFFS